MKDTIIRIMCIALPVIAACSVNADTKYWKSSPSNANLNDIVKVQILTESPFLNN